MAFPTVNEAQLVQISEEEIKQQETFIEAGKFRILGEYDKAIDILLPLLKERPDLAATAFELAKVYDQKRDLQNSILYLRQALRHDPTNSWYLMYNAELLDRNSLFAEAATAYQKVIDLKSSDQGLYYRMAAAQQRSGSYALAKATYQQIEDKFGYSEDVARRRIELAMDQNNLREAIAELERLNQSFPARIENLQFLADLYRQSGQTDKMKEIYTFILSVEPNNPAAQLNLSRTGSANSDAEVLSHLQVAMADKSQKLDGKIRTLIPFVQKLAQQPDTTLGAALIQLMKILDQTHPGEAKVQALSGDILQYSGDQKGAIIAYQNALKSARNIYSVWEQCGFLLAENQRWSELDKLVNEGLDYFPNQIQLHYLHGMAQAGLKNYTVAKSILENALLMQPSLDQSIDLHSLLGNVYYELKDYIKSDEAFEAALALDPNQINVLNNYARNLTQRNLKTDVSKSMLEKALKLRPDFASAETTLGIIAIKQNQLNQAKKMLDQALMHGGQQSAYTLEAYGDLQLMLKDVQQAVRYWQEAIEKGGEPNSLNKKIRDKKL
ncbi:MAG: tetratricopeptide repeat protein [Saprospiraceae bacterium]